MFLEDPKKVEKSIQWDKGENIPQDPGKEMLKYLAWREDFKLPCVILEGTDIEFMSSTILANSARGAHSISSIKQIVWDLINVSGMSPAWISRNLFLDIEDINKMIQLNGIKSAYTNYQDFDFGWIPEEDDSYKFKRESYIKREARNFLKENGIRLNGEDEINLAKKHGFKESDKDMRKFKLEIRPNGTRSEGRVINGYGRNN